jgi:gamma-glutamylcyclotransferase (GGCT)/AIG2-like uncharacterized protein YtfP
MSGTHHLFSYGTLQLESVQQANYGRLLGGTDDALVGYKLFQVEITDPEVLAKSGEKFHPIARPTGNTQDSVPGRVFEISDEELAKTDAYEVAGYKRVEADLASGGKAWVYIES